MSQPSCLLVLTLLAGAAAPASADLVTLRNGRVLEGETEVTTAGVWVKRPAGSVLLGHHDVLSVEARETPWAALERRLDVQVLGDAEQTLELAFFALDNDLGDQLERVVAWTYEPAALPPATPASLRLGMLCLEQGLEEPARRLLLQAIAANPHSPTATLGLQRLDFHLVEGAWQAPEVYYPGRGFVQFDGRWVLAEEVAVTKANRALVEARAAAGEAAEEARREERRLDRAQEELLGSQREAGQAQVAAEVAREVLRVRSQDLELAAHQALAARYDEQAYHPDPCADPHYVARHRQALAQARENAEQIEHEARVARDAALAEFECALEAEGSAPRWIADAKGEVLKHEAGLTRANDQAKAAAEALRLAEDAFQAAKRELVRAQQKK